MIGLVRRHCLLYFRDKTHVFFSMLSVLITILLYILFLSAIMTESIANELPDVELSAVGRVISGMVLAGTIAVATVSTSISGILRLVIDREDISKDFYVSPIARFKLHFSYVISSWIISFIMSFMALVATVFYLSSANVFEFSIAQYFKLLVTLILGVISANSMMFLFACAIRSRNAFSSISSIIGTLIGFLAGVYIPVGNLPAGVVSIIQFFPTAHTASMFRQVLAGDKLTSLMYQAPYGLQNEIESFFGVRFQIGEFTTGFIFSALLLVITSVMFYLLGIWFMKKRPYVMK